MKKSLSFFSILALLSFAVVGALSIVPHTHGSDWSHSSHQTCPVHQFGQASVHAELPLVAALLVVFLWMRFIEPRKSFVFHFFTPSISSRAPPTTV